MAKLNDIVKFLNKELKVKSMKDEWSVNGLQVRGNPEVGKVAVAVDTCMEVFESARKMKCDMVIVHHGILKPKKKLTAIGKSRINFLKRNKISLYGSHLPLDKSLEYGNNSGILLKLGIKPIEAFNQIGYIGYLSDGRKVESIALELGRRLGTKCKIWSLGKPWARKVAVCSGYGGSAVDEAIEKKADVLITGEVSHNSYVDAKEGKLSVILAGHYKTETVGVMNIGELLEKKFNIKAVFIDNPTGM
jgi:dinuclear metal center YbgI/SA1388 family protein